MADPMKIRAQVKGDITEIRVLMPRAMETGQRKDASGKVIPAHFIQNISVTLPARAHELLRSRVASGDPSTRRPGGRLAQDDSGRGSGFRLRAPRFALTSRLWLPAPPSATP